MIVRHLFIVGAFAAALSGCMTAESGTGTAQATVAEMPSALLGKWAPAIADCDFETGDSSKWLYVDARSVGSFEHMYPLTDVRVITPTEAVYSVAFESGMRLRLNGPSTVYSYRGDDGPIELVLCPVDPQ